jgi:hypothetical protein
MLTKQKLTDYKNFWLIWINAASSEKGMSLFQIQTTWGIKTNYLYHNEIGLKSPLFRCMIRDNYITKEGKRLKAEFGWIPSYILNKYPSKEDSEHWVPDFLLRTKWHIVQKFIEKYHPILFDIKNLKILYKNDKELLGKYGEHILVDIFLYVLFSNLRVFCKKYEADVVLRMIATCIALASERDLLNYMKAVDEKMRNVADFPILVKDENELSRILCMLKW